MELTLDSYRIQIETPRIKWKGYKEPLWDTNFRKYKITFGTVANEKLMVAIEEEVKWLMQSPEFRGLYPKGMSKRKQKNMVKYCQETVIIKQTAIKELGIEPVGQYSTTSLVYDAYREYIHFYPSESLIYGMY